MNSNKKFIFCKNQLIAILFLFILYSISIPSAIFFAKSAINFLHNDRIQTKPIASQTIPLENKVSDKVHNNNKNLKTIIKKFENGFYANISGKKILISLDENLSYILTKEIKSAQVLMGKDNWLFYKSSTDGDSIADFQGIKFFSETKKENIKNTLVKTNSYFSNQNIKFILLIAPNKEQINANHMPESVVKISSQSRTDLLVQYLTENTDISIIYPKEELIKLSPDYQLFYKYDTHWNQLGGYIAEQQILQNLFNTRNYLQNKTIYKEDAPQHSISHKDLARMLNMDWLFNFDDVHEFYISDSKIIYDFDNYVYYNNKATYNKTILLVGDSFRIGLIPHLSSDFSELHVFHRDDYNPELINETKPDIVISEFVERYSGNIDSFNFF